MVEEFFNCSLLGIVPILEVMDDWGVVDTLLKMFGDDYKIRIHLEKQYTVKTILYSYDGKPSLESWYLNGLLHRRENPSLVRYWNDGSIQTESWCINGEYHREDGPSTIEYLNGRIRTKIWYFNGLKHRVGGPAYIYYRSDGSINYEEWYSFGSRHRIDGPAMTFYYNNGNTEYWYINDKLVSSNSVSRLIV